MDAPRRKRAIDELIVDVDLEEATYDASSDPVLALAGTLTGMFPPNALELLRAVGDEHASELESPAELEE
ncbi:MAG: hypothetical protein JHC87_08160 [Thermoleophilaceae bacterium]|nr:hypothetical protein [Thermoleophilaceae bacterium]